MGEPLTPPWQADYRNQISAGVRGGKASLRPGVTIRAAAEAFPTVEKTKITEGESPPKNLEGKVLQ